MNLSDKIKAAYQRIRNRGDDGVWISLVPEEESLRRAEAIAATDLPLKGLLFGVKDNIDVAGVPTTAACPEFAYVPERHAHVVQRLVDAGAIPIGKTNLDQFATGLNGTRTPYPIPGNSIDPRYIPGGSSSGSAVAVALGEVDFALGTDTAGSGRVPAAFNNLIGFKPTKGNWSTTGLVPACRSLDCITVFTRTVAEALLVDKYASGFDAGDPYSRSVRSVRPEGKRIAVLRESQREFFGDAESAKLYQAAIEKAASLGWEIGEFDYEPFLEAAALLYSGPWVGERHAALKEFLEAHAEAVHPVVRGIVESALKFSATDAFRGQYVLAGLARKTAPTWESFDALLLPTAPTIYTIEEMLADPVRLNSNLGRYTNFVNLLDLCGLAMPGGFRPDGMPFGVTLIGPAWTEGNLARLAAEFLGETITPPPCGIHLAVVGAHLRGQPLNGQLTSLGARFVKACRTSPDYRLYALPNTTPAKPGMARRTGGAAIEVEVWSLSAEAFGKFVGAIPPPLGIGTITLDSGETVKSFLCEEFALEGAEDITALGGWRAYLESRK